MNIENVSFIRHPRDICKKFGEDTPAPIMRRHFTVGENLSFASLAVCALGIGKIYLNGKEITDAKLLTPFGDYTKTLWYNEFCVTELLCEGKNIAACALGNGFYNESLSTSWNFDKAPWRGSPRFLFMLTLCYPDKTEHIVSDENWLCDIDSSPYRFNQLRMGEVYDFNYSTNWMARDFDDSRWTNAVIAERPSGILRKCPAPHIKEDTVFECREMFRNRYGEYVFDFGQNMSGYVKLNIREPKGTSLHIVFAEQICADGRRKDNKMSRYYPCGETQFSTVISSGRNDVWKPDFSYYGFRYVIISGFTTEPLREDIQAVFLHQDVTPCGSFRCSDELLNSIMRLSHMATLSNLFNMPTDCPTREKLGWCNDSQASCEQMIQNFDMSSFYEKWMQDIFDAQRNDGDLPGIVPTGGWGYEWGSGPVSTGVLFEVPLRLYQYYGTSEMLKKSLPYMMKHLDFLDGKKNPESGLIEHGLDDWAGPWDETKCPVPLGFICTVLYIRFCSIAEIAARLSGEKDSESIIREKRISAEKVFNASFMTECGYCKIEEQTAIAMIIVNKLYKELSPLKEQLIRTVEKYDYHFHVGMVGIQYILPALDICGENELGYKLLTASGYPSYRSWIDMGATTLHEMFGDTMSCNHHMYSCVTAYFHNVILGIRKGISEEGGNVITIKPSYISALSYASGSYKTNLGTVFVEWERLSEREILLHIELFGDITAKVIGEKGYVTRECDITVKAGKLYTFSVLKSS